MRIGIFDSGIGGLTVFAAMARALPDCDLIYFGDTARVPYGTRSPQTVVRYCRRVASHLHDVGIDVLVIACNTATTHALPTLQRAGAIAGIEVLGVVEPGVQAALRVHSRGAVAVLGTEGTILGGAYQRSLLERVPNLEVHAVPCPLFVPLAEEGWLEGSVPEQVAEHYVGHLRGLVDTVILGCTHYPLFAPILSRVLPGVHLVDSAESVAAAVRQHVGPIREHQGSRSFIVTDHVERFARVGQTFLRHRPSPIDWVDIGAASGPFAEP